VQRAQIALVQVLLLRWNPGFVEPDQCGDTRRRDGEGWADGAEPKGT
jgi:hypothetical protein